MSSSAGFSTPSTTWTVDARESATTASTTMSASGSRPPSAPSTCRTTLHWLATNVSSVVHRRLPILATVWMSEIPGISRSRGRLRADSRTDSAAPCQDCIDSANSPPENRATHDDLLPAFVIHSPVNCSNSANKIVKPHVKQRGKLFDSTVKADGKGIAWSRFFFLDGKESWLSKIYASYQNITYFKSLLINIFGLRIYLL